MADERPVFGSDEFIKAIGRSVAMMPGRQAVLMRPEDFEVVAYALREMLALPDAADKIPGWVLGGAEKILTSLAKIADVEFQPQRGPSPHS